MNFISTVLPVDSDVTRCIHSSIPYVANMMIHLSVCEYVCVYYAIISMYQYVFL